MDADISERTATAMLYAIKSDTLFFNRQANRCDIEAFSYLYPLADAALIRKMEGAEITAERLQFVVKATERGRLVDQVFATFIGEAPREDIIPYVADFFLQLEHVRWTAVAGILNGSFVMSVRNLGYTRNAGDFVRRFFSDIGSAGGHRAMAKAIVPLDAFYARFGKLDEQQMTDKIQELIAQFLHESGPCRQEERAGRQPRSGWPWLKPERHRYGLLLHQRCRRTPTVTFAAPCALRRSSDSSR